MEWAIIYYLGITFLLFAIFVAIWIRTYSRKHKEKGEAPKYRMMDDEWEESGSGSATPGNDQGASPRPGSGKEPEDDKKPHQSKQ